MLANLITVIRSDVDDPDAFEWAPNAQWFVEDPAQVTTLPIDPTAAQITLQAEALLKGDLQNIMGGLPYASRRRTATIDQQTATGVSIITSIAQRIIQARKQHYLWAYAKLGQALPAALPAVPARRAHRQARAAQAGQAVLDERSPRSTSRATSTCMIDVTSDSLLRQERRAEAQSLLQLMASVQQVAAASGTPINMKAPIEAVLDAYDVTDKSAYFLQAPPGGAGLSPPGAPGLPAGPGTAPPQGLTNPEAAAGQLSPSNANSMSPEASMARLMAQRGTPSGA